jgi:hypothetical protein
MRGKNGRRVAAAVITTAFAQDDAEAAPGRVAPGGQSASSQAAQFAAYLDEAEADVLAYTSLPKITAPRCTPPTPLQRVMGEIKRRTDLVGISSTITSLTPRRPQRASLRTNAVQNVSASEGLMSRAHRACKPALATIKSPTRVLMAAYKRNQVEEAIASTLSGDDDGSPAEFRVRIKRLLEADRALGCEPASNDPERKMYAFYSDDAPGSGLEVWFSGYEAFALLLALQLQQHGWPQGTVIRIMRGARPSLEPQHRRILAQAPEDLFNHDAVFSQASPGALAVDNTDPVFLAIVTGVKADSSSSALSETVSRTVGACRGQIELMEFIRRQAPAGASTTAIEVVGSAHRLAEHLARTKPRTRGRRR